MIAPDMTIKLLFEGQLNKSKKGWDNDSVHYISYEVFCRTVISMTQTQTHIY